MELFFIIFALFLTAESNEDLINTCPDNRQWDPLLKICRECDRDMIYNTTLRKCVDLSLAYNSCNKGFKFDLYEKRCLDIDECNQKTDPCHKNEYCKNVPGSFICFVKEYCGQGYEYDTATQTCKDIDECARNLDFCEKQSVCENIPGSFHCRPPCPPNKKFYWNSACHQCQEGYRFNQTSKQCQDVDECLGPYKLECEPYKEICVRKAGLSGCVTHCSGGTLIKDGKCIDIDECAENTHNCTGKERCSNLFGTFTCSEIRCHKNEILNNATRQCVCKPGYKLNLYSQLCEDINECDDITPVCGIHGKCNNKIGNYECICNQGYEVKNGVCEDIDECKKVIGVCGHLKCENTPHGYKCVCPSGFKKTLEDTCEDINECADNATICRSALFNDKHQCYNLIGSFKCIIYECPAEYREVKRSANYNICQLIDTRCSQDKSEGCIQHLPEKHIVQVVEIPNSPVDSYNIGVIELDDLDFDHYYAKVIVHKAIDNKTNTKLEIGNAIMLTRSDDEKRISIHIVKPLPDDAEIVINVHIRSSLDSIEKSYAFYQFYVFVTNSDY